MRYLKFIVLGLSVLAVVLCFVAGVHTMGGQGIFALLMAVAPGILAALGAFVVKGFPRWAAGVSLICFLILGMKTSSESGPLSNIMLVAPLQSGP